MADEHRSLKCGRDQGSVSPPSKSSRVSREPSVEERPSLTGTLTAAPVSLISSMNVTQSMVVISRGGGDYPASPDVVTGYSLIRWE